MKSFVLLITLFAVCPAAFCGDITVADLRNKMPIGKLGKPLGTQVILTGARSERPMMDSNPIEVSEVDDKQVDVTLVMSIRGGKVQLIDGVERRVEGDIQFRKGVIYKLEGYESGEFCGVPSWLGSQAQQGFGYRPFFVVTKVIAPAAR